MNTPKETSLQPRISKTQRPKRLKRPIASAIGAVIAVVCGPISLTSWAQTETPTAASKLEVAKLECKKPEYPGKFASDSRFKSFQKALDTYKNCIKVYADEHQAQSKAHLDAAQAAIDEYNALVKEIQAAQGGDSK